MILFLSADKVKAYFDKDLYDIIKLKLKQMVILRLNIYKGM